MRKIEVRKDVTEIGSAPDSASEMVKKASRVANKFRRKNKYECITYRIDLYGKKEIAFRLRSPSKKKLKKICYTYQKQYKVELGEIVSIKKD